VTAKPKEILSLRVVQRSNGKGAVVYCRLGDGPEYILNYYRIFVHTEENEPGEITFSRTKAKFKELGPVMI
jgi:hypothetical protein